jgi:Sporulation and spore germination
VKRVLVLAGLVLAVAACGLPKDSAPRQIADDKVPFQLLGPSTTAPSANVEGGPTVKLYFLDGTQLRAVTRNVPTRDPQGVLNELVKGVIDTDPVGIATAIPKETQILAVVNDGDTLVVTLNSGFLNIGGAGQKNAFGQMVYTISDLGISGVRFRVADANGGNEQDVSVPTDNGTKAGPISKFDFITLEPK